MPPTPAPSAEHPCCLGRAAECLATPAAARRRAGPSWWDPGCCRGTNTNRGGQFSVRTQVHVHTHTHTHTHPDCHTKSLCTHNSSLEGAIYMYEAEICAILLLLTCPFWWHPFPPKSKFSDFGRKPWTISHGLIFGSPKKALRKYATLKETTREI